MRWRLRPHAGMHAHAWACARPGARDKAKACYPAPSPEEFWAGVLKTARPLECEKMSPIRVSGKVLLESSENKSMLRKRSVAESDMGRRRTMSTPVKPLDNMSKNLTNEERALREQAEEGIIPDRGRESRMETPAIMTKNTAAGHYWKKILERMEGLEIMDEKLSAAV